MITNILQFIFGVKPKSRFKRIVIFLFVVAIIIMLTLNISCGWDKKGGFYFKWQPAAEIKIEKK